MPHSISSIFLTISSKYHLVGMKNHCSIGKNQNKNKGNIHPGDFVYNRKRSFIIILLKMNISTHSLTIKQVKGGLFSYKIIHFAITIELPWT